MAGMKDFWTPQNEKLIVGISTGVVGYSIVNKAFVALPSLPAFLTKPIFGQISLLTILGGFAIYNLIMLYKNY